MGNNLNTTMCDKLFDLCELQLLAIIKDAEESIKKVTDSTSVAMETSAKLSGLVSDSMPGYQMELDLCLGLEQSFNGIITNMQFFDEFSQRIQHIKEIVDLIKLESDREGFLSKTEDSEKLFNNIKDIFSIQSEFDVMRDLFPEIESIGNDKAVELF